MRLIHSLAAAALLAAGGTAALAAPRSPEAQLAKELEGRVPGKPVDCVQLTRIRSTRIINRTAIIYDAGSTIYVNRPSGARTLNRHDVLLGKPAPGSQICKHDIVRTLDQGSHFPTGSVGLNEFVPYHRVDTASRR